MSGSGSNAFLTRFPALSRLALGRSRRRIPEVRQTAMTDCGAAALAMVLRYYGKVVPLDEIRSVLGSARNGAKASALLQAARRYGLRGRGVRVDMEELPDLPEGAVLFWEFRHYVVFQRCSRETVDIVDPASGRRSVSMEAFRRSFTGVALILEPSETFECGGAPEPRFGALFGAVVECRGLLFRLLTTSVLVQALSLTMPLLTAVLIDRVVPHRDYSFLAVLAIGYGLFELCNITAGFVRAHLMIHFRTQLEVRFTLRFIDHLVDLPYAFFQQHTSGDLMVRLGSNNVVREILTSTTLSAFLDGSVATLYLILLLLNNAWLACLVLALAAARILLTAFVRWRQRRFLTAALEIQANSQTSQVEMLSGMETLKAMGLEHRAAENWANLFVDGLNISISRGKLEALFNAAISLLGAASTFLLVFYGAYLVLAGSTTLGRMLAFNALATGFLTPLNNLASAAIQWQMLEVYLERLNDVIDSPTEQDPGATAPVGQLTGAVTLENVSFRYSGNDPLVLNEVSLKVEAGTRLALVGRTGSGKSTLARLIAGLYVPTSGRVLFDDKDLRSLELRAVRNQIGIVTQDTQLFSGSIRRNIALSDLQMDLGRVIWAARAAGIHDDIAAMPMAYETPLADRGLSLSGGQRQRLAIARALARKPSLLILDEATSHLDSVTEEKVNRNLAALGCTRIIVAHRLSTIQESDQIIVLDGGRIVEQGSHPELMALGGSYAQLVAALPAAPAAAARPKLAAG